MLELYKHVTFSEKKAVLLTVCKCLSIKPTNCSCATGNVQEGFARLSK